MISREKMIEEIVSALKHVDDLHAVVEVYNLIVAPDRKIVIPKDVLRVQPSDQHVDPKVG